MNTTTPTLNLDHRTKSDSPGLTFARRLLAQQAEPATNRNETSQAGDDNKPFDAHLAAAKQAFGDASLGDAEDAVRKGANEMLARAFFEPIFKMIREDPLRSDVMPLSSGEKMFGPMLDAHISRSMTEQANFPLAEKLVQSLLPPHMRKQPASEPKAEENPSAQQRADEHNTTTEGTVIITDDTDRAATNRTLDLHG